MSSEALPAKAGADGAAQAIEPPPGTLVKKHNEPVTAPSAAPTNERSCENCGAEMSGPFCGVCGQHERSVIRFFGSVVAQIFDDIFGWDSRAGRTLLPLLFRPGFLTNEYFAGRRVHYVPPIRLYLFVSIIFFLLLSFVSDSGVKELVKFQQGEQQSSVVELTKQINALSSQMSASDYVSNPQDLAKMDKLLDERKQSRTELEEVIAQFEKDIDEFEQKQQAEDFVPGPGDIGKYKGYQQALKQLKAQAVLSREQMRLDVIEQELRKLDAKLADQTYAATAEDALFRQSLQSERNQLVTMMAELKAEQDKPSADVGVQMDDKGEFSITMVDNLSFLSDEQNAKLKAYGEEIEQKAKQAFEKDAGPLIQQMLGVLPQVMFFMLPIFALLLKFFYLFAKRFYMEHLTVALHSHAFIFVNLTILNVLSVLFDYLQPTSPDAAGVVENIMVAFVIWVPVYLLLMQKRVYKQGVIFTLIKFGVVGLSYIMLLVASMVVTLLWGLTKL